MTDFDFVDQFISSPTLKYKLRRYFGALAILVSASVYVYIVDHFNKEDDFVSFVEEALPFSNQTYAFFSHSVPDEVSIYRKIGEAIEGVERPPLNVKLKGRKGSALENAYGVLNTPKSFGIVQSDTYLSAEFLKEKSRVQEITPLYMERLHIMIVDENEHHNFSVISKDKPESVDIIKEAIRNETLFAGRFNSSGRILLPHLLKLWGVDSGSELADIPEMGLLEMLEVLKDDKSNIGYPRVAIMIVGSSDFLLEELKSTDHNIQLFGLSDWDVNSLNETENVDLMMTNFGQSYGSDFSTVTTAGAMATLIGSNDLTTTELYGFIKMLSKVYKQDEMKRISSNPPILVEDVKEYFEEGRQHVGIKVFGSFLLFLVSVLSTSFLVYTILLNISSTIKQASFYKEIYRVYALVIDKNNSQDEVTIEKYEAQFQKAIRIIGGMVALEKIGRSLRLDYSTGGITARHHKYLIDNIRQVLDWFQGKLVNRLSFVIEKTPNEPEHKDVLRENILKWHSEGRLSLESYESLMGKL